MTKQNKIGAVAVVGGTHGNELTGVYTVKHWTKNLLAKNYPGFQIEFLLANLGAIEENKRYLDHDLNRCFASEDLNNSQLNSREQLLAKQINQQLGPKDNSRVDFIIDLHTSTANMQTNIVLVEMDEFHLKLAAYLKQLLPEVVITSEASLLKDHHFLGSIAPKTLLIEVGPIAQGCLDFVVFEKTNQALKAALDFIEKYNNQDLSELSGHLPVFEYFSKLHFPVDENNEICAMIHPNVIGRDYSKITKGTPIFKDFLGNDILYQGEDANIAFINEAAYYDSQIAMCLCRPVVYDLKTCQLVS
ncbi:aspartoacylase [Aliikangiella sp. IMCC44359]|uniref:aspartoacylase n=1 Tax=Aliikangiella sp. IMCC44359 TaxID=3459125 RepID=UPI00403A92F1